jgi:hypothetical protein
LIATEKALNIFGHSTVDWVREQGGHKDTIIFILGVHIKGPLPYIEGVFLNPTGVGFHPTWGIEQLIREVREGSWTVIPTETVLESWATKVERLMNKS